VKEHLMRRFRKRSHTLWHGQYPLVWAPTYRFRMLTGQVGEAVGRCIRALCEQLHCEIVARNVQHDHGHLMVLIPPKVSVSTFAGTVKGRTAIRVFRKFRH
jgi:putative transposase